jgi:hypothetical protein
MRRKHKLTWRCGFRQSDAIVIPAVPCAFRVLCDRDSPEIPQILNYMILGLRIGVGLVRTLLVRLLTSIPAPRHRNPRLKSPCRRVRTSPNPPGATGVGPAPRRHFPRAGDICPASKTRTSAFPGTVTTTSCATLQTSYPASLRPRCEPISKHVEGLNSNPPDFRPMAN